MVHVAQSAQIAGFDLYGRRQDDGSIELGHGVEAEIVEEWPDEVTLGPGFPTYTLEWVKKQTDDGVVRLTPDEAPDATPGLEWGVYV